MSLIYVAHPIDQRGHGEVAEPGVVEVALQTAGFDQYWPELPWLLTGRTDPEFGVSAITKHAIASVNRTALDCAWAMVALLPEGVPSLGVPAEIEKSLAVHKPVAIVTYGGALQAVQMSEWAQRGAHVTTGIEEAVRWLQERQQEVLGCEVARYDLRGQGKATERPRKASGDLLVRLDEGGILPKRTHDGDAGYDLYVSETIKIGPQQFVDVPCGIALEIPQGWWGLVTGRSSTMRSRGLLVVQGIIDQGYRGPMFVNVQNMGNAWVEVAKGDRLAQLILLPLFGGRVRQVEALADSVRGSNGYGSSGS